MVPNLPNPMNMREAREEFSIPHWTYSEEFKEQVRLYEQSVRNFENAISRMVDRGKNVRRSRSKRTITSVESGETSTA